MLSALLLQHGDRTTFSYIRAHLAKSAHI